MNENKLNSKLMYKAKNFSFYRDDIILDNNKKAQRDIININISNFIMHILIVDESNNFYLQNKFNPSLEKNILVEIFDFYFINKTLEQNINDILNSNNISNYQILHSNFSAPLVAYSLEQNWISIVKVNSIDLKNSNCELITRNNLHELINSESYPLLHTKIAFNLWNMFIK